MVCASYLPWLGGVETHVFEVSRRLVLAGLDVTVLTTDRTGRLPSTEESDGVKIRRVPAWPAKKDYYFAPQVYGVVRDDAWDLVNCVGYHTLVAPLAMLAAWRAKTSYIVTLESGGHSSRVRKAGRRIQWEVLRPLLQRAERLVAISKFEADFFRERLRLPASAFVVIPNGSDLPRVQQHMDAKANGRLILSIGRLEEYKGHHRILAALPKVRQHCPDARLMIVGAGPYEKKLRRLAIDLDVAEWVHIEAVPPDDRPRMGSLLSQAALVTLLSEYESQGIAVMEGLAFGKPALVANTSALAELAASRLVRAIPLESSPDEVADAVLKQLDQPGGTPDVELPTWDGSTAAILALYRAVLEKPACAS